MEVWAFRIRSMSFFIELFCTSVRYPVSPNSRIQYPVLLCAFSDSLTVTPILVPIGRT